jgi:uncharacterized protein
MPDRSKLTQSRPRGRLVARSTLVLAWCLTLLMVGSVGLVFQRIHRVYRLEMTGGRYALADPYQAFEQGAGKPGKRVAILIDDLGSEWETAKGFWELEVPVTLSILPYKRYSQEVAREAVRHGKEVLLHLPLQPQEYPAVNPGAGSLLLSMDREGIQAEIAAQLDSLPPCVGVSSHMGSCFTEQRQPMLWVLSVLGERNLFFVDSMTTPDSIARGVAMELGVPFAQRTHFLDLEKTEESIVRQLLRLAEDAVRSGGAIGIAHPSAETLAALPKVVVGFSEKGVRIVPVSEMVSSPRLSGPTPPET